MGNPYKRRKPVGLLKDRLRANLWLPVPTCLGKNGHTGDLVKNYCHPCSAMDVIDLARRLDAMAEPLFPRLLSFKNHRFFIKAPGYTFWKTSTTTPQISQILPFKLKPQISGQESPLSTTAISFPKRRFWHLCCHHLCISHSILPLQLQGLLWCFHHTWHTARGTNHSLHVVLGTLKFCNDGLQTSWGKSPLVFSPGLSL